MTHPLNRRDFFRIGGTTLFGLSLTDFMRAQAAGKELPRSEERRVGKECRL